MTLVGQLPLNLASNGKNKIPLFIFKIKKHRYLQVSNYSFLLALLIFNIQNVHQDRAVLFLEL
jgi:hypothetical protein